MVLQGDLYSTALDMDTAVIFVAANNFTKEPPRKVCYLLHGLQGRCDNFLYYTQLADLCREYHCLFVLPDAQRSFYADMEHGGAYFTYLTQELPRTVANLFRVSEKPEDTVIMGASMGGYGALKAALTCPEKYGFCAAFSPCCLDMQYYLSAGWRDGTDGDAFRRIFGDQLSRDFNAAFGTEIRYRPETDLLALAEKNANGPHPHILTLWGDQDIFRDSNRAFPEQMEALGWTVDGREMPGNHSWVFFNEALKQALPLCLK